MAQLTVSTWNINQRSGLGKNIPDLVFNEILQLDSDILVLTEFVKVDNYLQFFKKLKSVGYDLFTSENSDYDLLCPATEKLNEILIAVKSNLVKKPILKKLPQERKNPDFLHLTINFENEPLHIIGARIKIKTIRDIIPSNVKFLIQVRDAKERLLQVNKIVNYIKNLNGRVLLMGDFNNFHYYENQEVNSWEHDKEFLQNYYSYPLIISRMNEVNMTAYTPRGRYDKVFSWVNPKVSVGNKRYIRNDHIFANITLSNENYSWEFLKNPDYKNQVGYPDHAILTAMAKL